MWSLPGACPYPRGRVHGRINMWSFETPLCISFSLRAQSFFTIVDQTVSLAGSTRRFAPATRAVLEGFAHWIAPNNQLQSYVTVKVGFKSATDDRLFSSGSRKSLASSTSDFRSPFGMQFVPAIIPNPCTCYPGPSLTPLQWLIVYLTATTTGPMVYRKLASYDKAAVLREAHSPRGHSSYLYATEDM
jgi:hypothetical protein